MLRSNRACRRMIKHIRLTGTLHLRGSIETFPIAICIGAVISRFSQGGIGLAVIKGVGRLAPSSGNLKGWIETTFIFDHDASGFFHAITRHPVALNIGPDLIISGPL